MPTNQNKKGNVATTSTTRFDAIKAEANFLAGLDLPYTNVRPPSTTIGFDCSSSCAQLMMSAGYKVPYFNTSTAPEYMIKGKDPTGRLTFWNDDFAGTGGDSVHMFAEIEGRQWGTGPNGNPAWNEHTTEGFGPWHISKLDEPAALPTNASNTNVEGSNEGGSFLGASTTAKAAAISSFLELPGLLDSLESEALKGKRSLMNDKPLLPFVEELAKASLRNFMSMPNGNFYAFIPDYFGGLTDRQAYWEIKDIEILDGTIYLSDDALATHVYVVGDLNADNEINIIDKVQTAGVVTVFNAFMANFITGSDAPGISQEKVSKSEREAYHKDLEKVPSLANKQKAIGFLEKYGPRPYYEEAPMVRSAYFEMFLAYQQFCLLWSQQFQAQFELTFMPELFPGGIVAFPDYGIQCYIQEVNHRGDYQSGFTTIAKLIAPAATPSGRKGVSAGMVRAKALSVNTVNANKPEHKQNN